MPQTVAEARPPDSGPHLLPASTLASIVDDYIRSADARPWNVLKSFDWAALRPGEVSRPQRSALAFVTYVEDHIPGYLAELYRRHPLDQSVTSEQFMHNRELFRFYARWVQDEESHSHVLFRYQVESGMTSADALRAELARVGAARFEIPGADPVHAFTYTVIQEKATQLFYQQFAHVAQDEVLREIMKTLARDEARHFSFFARLLEAYLEHFGASVLPAIEQTLKSFQMPLSRVLTRYWRWSIEVADAVGGYDHVDAYPSLLRVIQRVQDASLRTKSREIERFVRSVCRTHEPAGA